MEEAALERAIARRFGQDPDDPAYAAGLRRNRMNRDDRRVLKSALTKDPEAPVNEWAVDAYRAYYYLLREGLGGEAVKFRPHVDLPDEVLALQTERRRLLPAELVARWAYRHRVQGERFTQIAQSQFDFEPSDARLAQARRWLTDAVARGDGDEALRVEGLISLIQWQSKGDHTRSDDSIRKVVKRNELIWQVAEREASDFALPR